MQEFLNEIQTSILQTSWEEWLAFITSIVYVWLAARQHIACWIFGIISSAIYVYLCFKAQIYAESMLQSFYVAVAFWGWINWRKGTKKLKIIRWTSNKHLISMVICTLSSLLIGYLLSRFTDQVFPYLDAALFSFSIFATYLITIKVLENWLYFIVIDLLATPLYWNRGYYLTAFLYLIYTVIAIDGFRKWKSEYNTLQK